MNGYGVSGRLPDDLDDHGLEGGHGQAAEQRAVVVLGAP